MTRHIYSTGYLLLIIGHGVASLLKGEGLSPCVVGAVSIVARLASVAVLVGAARNRLHPKRILMTIATAELFGLATHVVAAQFTVRATAELLFVFYVPMMFLAMIGLTRIDGSAEGSAKGSLASVAMFWAPASTIGLMASTAYTGVFGYHFTDMAFNVAAVGLFVGFIALVFSETSAQRLWSLIGLGLNGLLFIIWGTVRF